MIHTDDELDNDDVPASATEDSNTILLHNIELEESYADWNMSGRNPRKVTSFLSVLTC
jgi:hypothetical protein